MLAVCGTGFLDVDIASPVVVLVVAVNCVGKIVVDEWDAVHGYAVAVSSLVFVELIGVINGIVLVCMVVGDFVGVVMGWAVF
mgnify:FL=1